MAKPVSEQFLHSRRVLLNERQAEMLAHMARIRASSGASVIRVAVERMYRDLHDEGGLV